jgi:4-aminobutyrate--pyruvate transaminase
MNKKENWAPNSAEGRDLAHHLHPYTNPAQLSDIGPHIMRSGDGIYVTDNDNNKFIEGVSGLWCTSLGFSENELVEAAIKQMRKLPYYHSFGGKTVNPSIDLAEKLMSVAPSGLEKVFFCNSGSEANDTAVKMVWYFQGSRGKPEKQKIISRKQGYHGVTIAAASLTGLNYTHDGFPLPLDFAKHTCSPHYFANGRELETEEEFVARIIAELEELIESEGAETIGAMIAEPVMGAGGVIIPPKGYFEAIQKTLKKHSILLIADEVICGFGRTGNMWGSQTFDLQPDILTCAKALSSAYLPISAVLVSSQVAKGIEEQASRLGIFGHGYTYTAHPVSAAVALRTLELMEERKITEHVKAVSKKFCQRVHQLSHYKCVGDTRAVGLIGAMEFVGVPETRIKIDPSQKFAAKIQKLIQDSGVILRALPGDSIGFCPPLIITEPQIDEMFDKIEKVMPTADALALSLEPV